MCRDDFSFVFYPQMVQTRACASCRAQCCVRVTLTVCLTVCVSLYLSVCLSVCLSLSPSHCLCLSHRLCLTLSVSPSVDRTTNYTARSLTGPCNYTNCIVCEVRNGFSNAIQTAQHKNTALFNFHYCIGLYMFHTYSYYQGLHDLELFK
jgi:hypothetical protein